jgi:hypothetical protein
LILNVIFHL